MCKSLHTSWPQCPRTVPSTCHLMGQSQPKCLTLKTSAVLWCLLLLQEASLQSAENHISHMVRDHLLHMLHAGVLTDILSVSYRHLSPQFHSSLTSLYEKPTFWYRTLWTMCHRLWGPEERGPQALLWIVLFCSTASWSNPSPPVRVEKEGKGSLGTGQKWHELFRQGWFGP